MQIGLSIYSKIAVSVLYIQISPLIGDLMGSLPGSGGPNQSYTHLLSDYSFVLCLIFSTAMA